jgi:hypothetical protein
MNSLSAAIAEGGHSFTMNTSYDIPGATGIPYSLSGNFPLVQWESATISTNDPLMMEVKARAYGSTWSLTAVNDKNSAAMTL